MTLDAIQRAIEMLPDAERARLAEWFTTLQAPLTKPPQAGQNPAAQSEPVDKSKPDARMTA